MQSRIQDHKKDTKSILSNMSEMIDIRLWFTSKIEKDLLKIGF